LDDYLLADFHRAPGEVVNFYVAYYARQEKGSSPHSPRVCIPGGGWSITDFSRGVVQDHSGAAIPVNRAELELHSRRQLVYYWFDQRGRRIANEYLMKWYLFRDSLELNRTDGALVRVSTMVRPGEAVEQADRRIIDFIRYGTPLLPDYLPN
jgi:EpsI family protein